MPGPAGTNFWQKADYPKWREPLPRVLCLAPEYFLSLEIRQALRRLGVPARHLALPRGLAGDSRFIERLLRAVLEFRPDFLLTVNHLGLDREGALMDLLAKLRLPLASWFVDDPLLILHAAPRLVSPWCLPFCFDRDKLAGLKALGFGEAWHLPLASDATRFTPGRDFARERRDVSFVGNSMLSQVSGLAQEFSEHPLLYQAYPQAARDFAASPKREVREFLSQTRPELETRLSGLDEELRLKFERLVTFEATRLYRLDCLGRLLPFGPLIAGDAGWPKVLSGEGSIWNWQGEIDYYRELPDFYRASRINFNCTSLQMKGAPNQRAFDVPACEGFVLTDYREQLAELFEPGKEVIFYSDPGEIGELIRHYLAARSARLGVAKAARARVLREHTYDLRLGRLMQLMRATYA